jgi:hypothetical protein
MPSDKGTKKFHICVIGRWYADDEILQYFSASEAQIIFQEEPVEEYDPDAELERLQQKSWWDKI